ncbi:response regulator transcription factor [Micromonospora polyrhachis]|uniref:DNA-binding NarL/FixJ family response regulator n=1 Tax=Micromonospora polyrhachis TaxID=1282883 RepID=A0A7W7SSB9_9ACTN|nr:response regulator transcription factor [Micromonospora polyrhachis]MBB4959931.1 DNA-binding NarL/FixJ family response regulator [Micromonospora polyrhachis]
MTTRIVIADDQDDIRGGYRIILDAQPDMQVLGEAADGVTAVELARRLRPDVVLVDIRMPRMNGLEVTRLLAGPDVPDPLRVIVVTTFDLDEYVHTALHNGACGFLLKRAGPALLVEGVRAAAAGDALISPSITTRLLRHFAAPRPRADDGRLTGREAEVATLVARGRTNAEIAAELSITPGTAKTHVASIQHKLGVRNRVEIAAWAWQSGQARP